MKYSNNIDEKGNDVLDSLTNLSSDEVFTSAKAVEIILERIPSSFWTNPNVKILNPFSKTGIFLREIIIKLDEGLKKKIPNRKKRINHILKNNIFSFPITKMTSFLTRRTIYTSRFANGKYSLGEDVFTDKDGNVFFDRVEHTSDKTGKCKECGIAIKYYNDEFENYAYSFIHENTNKKIKEMKKMKFDLIIGNPPYQLKDGEGGGGASAKPIYQLFVNEAIKMNPDHLMMVIPSRWFGGGKGLDKFRDKMLHLDEIKEIHDWDNAKLLFPSIQLKGGVNFFYYEKGYSGEKKYFKYKSMSKCDIYNIKSLNSEIAGKKTGMFVRNQFALKIFNKIWNTTRKSMSNTISSSKPFGLRSNEYGTEKHSSNKNYELISRTNKKTYVSPNDPRLKNKSEIMKWNVAIPKAVGNAVMSDKNPNAIKLKPGQICTETYITKSFENEVYADSFISFLKTNIFRFLFNALRYSHNTTKSSYMWIPELEWDKNYTDEILLDCFNISKNEYTEILKELGEENAK